MGSIRYRNISSHGMGSNFQRPTSIMQSSPPKLTQGLFTSKSSTPTSLVTALATSSQNGNQNKAIKRISFEPKRLSLVEATTDNSSRLHRAHSQRTQGSPLNHSLVASSSGTSISATSIAAASTVIASQNTSGGTVTVSPTINPLKHSIELSPISSASVGGEPSKRKRGRPRILDSDSEVYRPPCGIEEQNQQGKYRQASNNLNNSQN